MWAGDDLETRGLLGKKCSIVSGGVEQGGVEQSGGKRKLQRPSTHVCPSAFALCLKSGTAETMGEEKDDFEKVDAPMDFKSDAWTHFGSPVSRNEKGENKTKQKNYTGTGLSLVTYTLGKYFKKPFGK